MYESTGVLLFPRAFYYEGFDPWTYPLNRGRLAEALLLFGRVRLVTDGFTEIIALVEELGADVLLQLIEDRKLQFILQPYFFAEISGGSIDWDIGSAVLKMFGDVVNGTVVLGEAIQHSLVKSPYDVPDIGPELLGALENTTALVPPSIVGIAKEDLARDLLDSVKMAKHERLLADHFGKECPIQEVFEAREDNGKVSIQMRPAVRDSIDEGQVKQASHGLLMLLEVGQQLAVSAWAGADFVSSNPLFEQVIAVKSGRQDLALMSAATSFAGLTAAMHIMRLPDICFLVNSDLVPLKRAISFGGSQHGKRVREFLVKVGGPQENQDLEKAFFQKFAENLMPTRKLEELAENGLLGSIVFVVGQGLSIANPIVGGAFALAEKGARTAIGKRWKPLPVIKKHLVGNVLARDVDRERDRRFHYPSLDKLASQGYEVAIVREFPESEEPLGEVILAAQEGKMHWHVVVARDRDGAQYLVNAKERQPSSDSASGRLLEMLGSGRLQSAELFFLEGSKQRVAFSVKTAKLTKVIDGDYDEFAQLLEAHPYLLDPDKANETLKTREL